MHVQLTSDAGKIPHTNPTCTGLWEILGPISSNEMAVPDYYDEYSQSSFLGGSWWRIGVVSKREWPLVFFRGVPRLGSVTTLSGQQQSSTAS